MTVKDNIEVICDILEDILEGYDKGVFTIKTDSSYEHENRGYLDIENYKASSVRVKNLLAMLCESGYIFCVPNTLHDIDTYRKVMDGWDMRLSMKGFEFLAKYRGENDKKEDMLDILLKNAERDKTIDNER